MKLFEKRTSQIAVVAAAVDLRTIGKSWPGPNILALSVSL